MSSRAAARPHTAFVHYTAPPVVGGVEAVIHAHARVFLQAGYPVTVVAGRGEEAALPAGTDLFLIPELDSQHPAVLRAGTVLERGRVPADFDILAGRLADVLGPVLDRFDSVIVHNVFTKHFNLALTAALARLLDAGRLRGCIAWCHDLSWTSPNSRSKVFDGYPWDLLRDPNPRLTYVAVSRRRQSEMAGLFGCPAERIHVVYNGVEPPALLGLSAEGWDLAERLDLPGGDLNLLMPVRITRAKNIEFALRLAAALKAQGRNPRLVITGPPDPHDENSMAYLASLRALRDELGLRREARFVFGAGPDPAVPYTIGLPLVGELLRLADVMLMASHREGFGLPVLEAGLAGVPVATTHVPAAVEIGPADVLLFDAGRPPDRVAAQIVDWLEANPVARLRRRVRQGYTWPAIFRGHIRPLLQGNEQR